MSDSSLLMPGWDALGIPVMIVNSEYRVLHGSALFANGTELFARVDNPELHVLIKDSIGKLALRERFERDVVLLGPEGAKISGILSFVRMDILHQGGTGTWIVTFQDTTTRAAMDNVMSSIFDKFIQTNNDLDEANKKIKAQSMALNRFRQKTVKELDVARTVQRAIITKNFPEGVNFEVHGINRPSDQIGGDYLDVFQIDNRFFGIIVADVSGHGVGPALITATLRAWSHELFQKNRTLDLFFRDLNRVVYDTFSETGFYLTAIAMILDNETGMLTVSSAGHDPVLRFSDSGLEEIGEKTAGRVIGALDDSSYRYETYQLQKGEVLVAFTDGISECRNQAGGFFSKESLISTLEASPKTSAKDMVATVMAALDDYAAGEKPHDDQTLLILRWLGEA